MNHTLCGEVDPKTGRWRCARPTGHGGDHIASIGPYLDGDDALAQWPRRADMGADMHTIVIASILSQRTKEGMVEFTLNGEKTQMDLAKAREVRGMLDGAIEAAVSDERSTSASCGRARAKRAGPNRSAMQIPEKRECDLCHSELTGPYVVMSYPLDQVDREALAKELSGSMPGPIAIFAGMFDMAPKTWRFDFCRGCADGFMPMLAELKTQAVKTWLAERQRRTEAPVGEHE